MKNFFKFLVDLIYRKKCYICGRSVESLTICSNCFDELINNDKKVARIINGVNVYSCGIYEKNLQKIIRGLKYHNRKELAFYLAKFMYDYFIELNITKHFQIIPVPLHQNRIKKRKYNHMELVAEEFCKLSGDITNFGLIKRIKDTKPQYKLNRTQRMENLSDAFSVNKNTDLKMPVLIIDDICTTGSTFEEMINTLKKEGITDITCLSASNP